MKRRSFLQYLAYLTGGIGAIAAGVPFVKYLLPSARARALGGAMEVDLFGVGPG